MAAGTSADGVGDFGAALVKEGGRGAFGASLVVRNEPTTGADAPVEPFLSNLEADFCSLLMAAVTLCKFASKAPPPPLQKRGRSISVTTGLARGKQGLLQERLLAKHGHQHPKECCNRQKCPAGLHMRRRLDFNLTQGC